MSFTLLLCGEGAREVAKVSEPVLEEIASRGKVAILLSDFDAPLPVVASPRGELIENLKSLREEGAAVVALLGEASADERERLRASDPDAVLVFWGCANQAATERPHLDVREEANIQAGLRQVFGMLEGLGYLPRAGTAISAAEDAALVERLKELGYV